MDPKPRPAAVLLADLQALDRENDRLEHRLALVRQSLKAAEAHVDTPDAVAGYLDRAARQLRQAG
jgi:predicted  nucleic acid-binding Zn-ribbon protein